MSRSQVPPPLQSKGLHMMETSKSSAGSRTNIIISGNLKSSLNLNQAVRNRVTPTQKYIVMPSPCSGVASSSGLGVQLGRSVASSSVSILSPPTDSPPTDSGPQTFWVVNRPNNCTAAVDSNQPALKLIELGTKSISPLTKKYSYTKPCIQPVQSYVLRGQSFFLQPNVIQITPKLDTDASSIPSDSVNLTRTTEYKLSTSGDSLAADNQALFTSSIANPDSDDLPHFIIKDTRSVRPTKTNKRVVKGAGSGMSTLISSWDANLLDSLGLQDDNSMRPMECSSGSRSPVDLNKDETHVDTSETDTATSDIYDHFEDSDQPPPITESVTNMSKRSVPKSRKRRHTYVYSKQKKKIITTQKKEEQVNESPSANVIVVFSSVPKSRKRRHRYVYSKQNKKIITTQKKEEQVNESPSADVIVVLIGSEKIFTAKRTGGRPMLGRVTSTNSSVGLSVLVDSKLVSGCYTSLERLMLKSSSINIKHYVKKVKKVLCCYEGKVNKAFFTRKKTVSLLYHSIKTGIKKLVCKQKIQQNIFLSDRPRRLKFIDDANSNLYITNVQSLRGLKDEDAILEQTVVEEEALLGQAVIKEDPDECNIAVSNWTQPGGMLSEADITSTSSCFNAFNFTTSGSLVQTARQMSSLRRQNSVTSGASNQFSSSQNIPLSVEGDVSSSLPQKGVYGLNPTNPGSILPTLIRAGDLTPDLPADVEFILIKTKNGSFIMPMKKGSSTAQKIASTSPSTTSMCLSAASGTKPPFQTHPVFTPALPAIDQGTYASKIRHTRTTRGPRQAFTNASSPGISEIFSSKLIPKPVIVNHELDDLHKLNDDTSLPTPVIDTLSNTDLTLNDVPVKPTHKDRINRLKEIMMKQEEELEAVRQQSRKKLFL